MQKITLLIGTVFLIAFITLSSCNKNPAPSYTTVQNHVNPEKSRPQNAPGRRQEIAANTTDLIVIDQIGYRTNSTKWFMIKNPQQGYDASKNYEPGTSAQLRRSSDNSMVKEIALSPWNGGKVDEVFSGDQVWQGEFSDVKSPGTYYIHNPNNGSRSYDFEIGDNVYSTVLGASLKSFYYQRSNVVISAKHGGEWVHELDHIQQKSARLYNHSKGGDQGKNSSRDISGGWYDAGDFRKYTSWMAPTIWNLSYAYEWYPNSFSDANGIPESGNGVPDIVDEIKVSIDWLIKMQREDGSLYSGCFVVKGIPHMKGEGRGDPSIDDRPYFYADISTSATASGATAFAIGARLFKPFEKTYPGYADLLRISAEKAWSYLEKNKTNIQYDHTDFDNANANRPDDADKRLRVLAAAELFRLTNREVYHKYFRENYNHPSTMDKTHQPIINEMFETGRSAELQRGLISYALSPAADQAISTEIKTALKNGIEWVILKDKDKCPYKAYIFPEHYHWGSNAVHAHWANIVQYGVVLKVNPTRMEEYLNFIEEQLHYFHGRNATGYCYLTQCNLFGAEKQIEHLYHSWFHHGTKFEKNPAPGFLAGGPNQYFKPGSSSKQIVPPQNQPPMKSYRDWNVSWPENSWEITENQISYQANHVLLAAAFAQNGPSY